MTIPEAIISLEKMNKWRRSETDETMPDVTEFGLAVDLAVQELKRLNSEVTGDFKKITFRSKV